MKRRQSILKSLERLFIGCHDDDSNDFILEENIFESQSYTWDCGISCIKMVINHSFKTDEEAHTIDYYNKYKTSLWTIDIFYELKCLGFQIEYCTLHIGAREDLFNLYDYYKHQINDKERAVSVFNICQVSLYSYLITSCFNRLHIYILICIG